MEVARTAFWFEGSSLRDSVTLGVAAANAMWGEYVAPFDHVKQKDRLEGAMRYYFDQWPMDRDELTPEPGGVECVFSFPLDIAHPDTGKPIHYAGRYDMRGFDAQKRVYAMDEKTTKRLGDMWFDQWDMDTQMTGYIYAIKRARPNVEVQARVRGISILRPKRGCTIGEYGHAEVDIVRSDWQLEQWRHQLDRDVRRMIALYREGEWDMNLGEACNSYNRPCEYKMLCLNMHPERLIPGNYGVEIWNPLVRK